VVKECGYFFIDLSACLEMHRSAFVDAERLRDSVSQIMRRTSGGSLKRSPILVATALGVAITKSTTRDGGTRMICETCRQLSEKVMRGGISGAMCNVWNGDG
jgi:hypothetical protein